MIDWFRGWKTGCAVQTTVRSACAELSSFGYNRCFRVIRNDLQTKSLPIGDFHAQLILKVFRAVNARAAGTCPSPPVELAYPVLQRHKLHDTSGN